MSLGYAHKCAKAYSPGKEVEYVQCVIEGANKEARKHSGGGDRNIVVRATLALVDLQTKPQGGVSIAILRNTAKFTSYQGSGLWPWFHRDDRLEVVEKPSRGHVRVVDRFLFAFHSPKIQELLQKYR
jgi:hypothetical protein